MSIQSKTVDPTDQFNDRCRIKGVVDFLIKGHAGNDTPPIPGQTRLIMYGTWDSNAYRIPKDGEPRRWLSSAHIV